MVDRVSKNTATKGRAMTASPPARPFQCQWHEGCPKSFNRKSDLQRHYRIHTNERPYACDYSPCEKTFIQRSALTVHRRTHTGDKPHKCPYLGCGKCFSDSSSLARHRRIHTNDKPYICKNPQCRKAFCRKTTMTKHFRKEHPAESIDHEEDADYSDVEQSDDEPSPDQDREDSPDSLEYFRDLKVKSETPVNAAASNYDASLWRLPAQTAQRPTHDQGAINADLRPGLPPQTVKMERSLSGTPQRALTDPARNPQIATTRYLGNRANTMPNTVSRSSSVDMAMWQAQQLQGSPTSMTPSQPFSMQTINAPTSAPTHYQHQPLPIRHPNLQPVHDIILDDPQQPHYSQTQPNYTAMQSPHYGPPPSADFRDEMPRTPAPNQPLPQLPSSMETTGPYQPPQALPMDDYNSPIQSIYNLPAAESVNLYNNTIDVYKDLKLEDLSGWTDMPEQVIRWEM